MSDFETPIMRDISKLVLPILIGIVLALALTFLIVKSGYLVSSIEFEMEAFEKGYTWADKQPNGCFVQENRYTCSTSTLPWEIFVWVIPVNIGLIITIITIHTGHLNSLLDRIVEWILARKIKKMLESEKNKLHNQYHMQGLSECPDCGLTLQNMTREMLN